MELKDLRFGHLIYATSFRFARLVSDTIYETPPTKMSSP
jgi:hypothetical protein